ncbi:hypothetical protein T03_4852 [Trichinella britovi]|uniref:Uncharacterized protein n=1 Tax=Trichinella britovi TaxID=45882 RepID=A0A0V1CZ48_TRIBR|nr:hypothetical protein T03_4852 [Trichinella britovi]
MAPIDSTDQKMMKNNSKFTKISMYIVFGNFGAVQSCDPMNCKVVVLEYLSGAKRSHGRLVRTG